MLYYRLTTLSIACALGITKSYGGVIFCFIKRCISCSSFIQLSHNNIESTDKKNVDTVESKKSVAKRYNKKLSPKLCKDLQNVNPNFREKILQIYGTLDVKHANLYLISHEVGDKFVELIKDDLLENMSHVIELNPGFGILTEKLLNAGIPFINLYEKYIEYYSELNHSLNNTYPSRFNIKRANLFKVSKLINTSNDFALNKNLCSILNNAPEKKWEESSCMQIIGTTTNLEFIRHILISTICQTGFMMYGRPIFYLAISPSLWNKLTNQGRSMSTNYILFNTLLDYKMFGTIDRKGFIPWTKINTIKDNNYDWSNDIDVLYVIKLEPKSDIFTRFNGKENLIYFWHFVRHYFYKPSLRVIPSLEKIVPGCGVRLIEKNYNIFTEFGHLNYNEICDLFIYLTSWAEFKESSFLLSANDMKNMYHPYMEEESNE